jgi:hypothetical protein
MAVELIKLEKFFKYDLSIARLKRLQPVAKTPVMDTVYPTAKRDPYPKSRIAQEDLPAEVKNFPVIVRGSASYAVPADETKVHGYEPFPIELTQEISDAQLNDMRNLTDEDINSFIDLKVQKLKEGCVATAGALALQSLTGKISYAAQRSPGNFAEYAADFGDIWTYNPAKLWDAAGVTIADIFTSASDMSELLGRKGFDSRVAIFCGTEAFKQLVQLAVLAPAKNLKINVTGNKIEMPGFEFIRITERYYDYRQKQYVPGIDPKKIVAVGLDAPFWLPFCSLDNADAGFRALSFWSSVKRSPTGKGYIIQGESKPFPVPIVEAICEATVVS